MKFSGIDQETARFFGLLLLLGAGLAGVEVLVGIGWMDIAPFDLRPVLAGLGILIAAAGILSVTSLRIGARLPHWHRWIYGLGMGVLVPLKLELTHPSSMAVAFALTSLVVVWMSRTLDDGDAPRVLAVTFLLLFVLAGGWFEGLAVSIVGEITLSALAPFVLGIFLAVLYQLPDAAAEFVEHRAWVVSGVLIGLFLVGMVAWRTMEPREEVTSYFSGTVPEVQGPARTSPGEMPNVILISVDTLRLDRVPPWADEELRVPTLRTLMSESVRYDRLYSPSSWTLPSHASLFTGLPPMGHGAVTQSGSRIYAAVPSYVQMLNDIGYQTAAFTDGGYMSESFGFGRGFDYYPTYYSHERTLVGLRPGILEWGEELLNRLSPSTQSHPPGTKPDEYLYFWENLRAARTWLSNERDPNRPFFMFLHTYQAHDYPDIYPRTIRRLREKDPKLAKAVHQMGGTGEGFRPLTADEERQVHRRLDAVENPSVRGAFTALEGKYPAIWNVIQSWVLSLKDDLWDRYLELSPGDQKKVLHRAALGAYIWGVPATPNLRTDYATTPYNEWLRSTFDLKPETVREIRAGNRRKMEGMAWMYDDLVEDVDRSLGDFLDHLRSRGLYDNTMIVFLSDHGEGFSWSPPVLKHGPRRHLDGRGQLHDALTHVPLSIKPPNSSPDPRVCGELYQLQDVFPIVFRQLGIYFREKAPTGKLGRSDGESGYCPPSRRDFARGSVSQLKPWLEFHPRFYVRGEEYRLEAQRDPRAESFWTVDGEGADQPVPPDAVPEATRERLRGEMEEYLNRYDQHPDPYRRRDWEADEELEAQLRGLGYF